MAAAVIRLFAGCRRSRRRYALPTSLWVGCRRSRRLYALPTSLWVAALIGLLLFAGSAFAQSLPVPQPTANVSDGIDSPAASVSASVPIPSLAGHVVNQTTLLTDAQTAELDRKLAKFEAGTGRRIAILMASDIGDENCDDYAQRVFKDWNLGSGSRGDGVLIMECERPFGHRIVVGHDLQATITPAIADRIYSEDMVLKMIGGDEVGGLEAGVDRIIAIENGKPMPAARPENSFDWGSAADWFSPPPLGTWTVTLVGMIFLFFVTVAVFGWKSMLVRGGCTFLTVGVVPLIAGSGIGFALIFATPAAVAAAIYGRQDGPEPNWDSRPSRRGASSVSGWRIFGGILGMVAGSALGSGGGGGGFRSGGGGFSGGGASGSW